ncbi:fimbrial protein [Acinetobacter rathckeae]|uniref:fimbrial protein n=1 Tax=Acinetobacter rathckeae TaxID=2605272 RepID=UPI0018A30E51|nr:fimbrial protein [Acinetobacter rathckeae]MBF7695746.1 fimbrial protein [Acinetobacter rathckeae]
MKKILMTSLLGFSGMAFSALNHAACIQYSGFITTDINMALGRIVVRPTDAVGKILVKKQFSIPQNNSVTYCDRNGGYANAVLSKNPNLSTLGDSIYDTNIPGIGIRLYRELPSATYFSGYYPYRRTLGQGPWNLGEGYFVVEIIKTANQTGSGQLASGRYSSYYTNNYEITPILTSTLYVNTASISSASCAIQGNVDKTVTLPTVASTSFTGIGSTQGEQSLNISILCNGGSTTSTYTENSQISLSFGFTADSSSNQVIKNTASGSKAATGIGLQLISDYNNQNKVIENGSHIDLGSISTNQNAQYDVPLRARYYQTANKVTAGEVKGIATLTVEYQ